MRITVGQLRRVIREEVQRALGSGGRLVEGVAELQAVGTSEGLADYLLEFEGGVLYDLQARSWADPRVEEYLRGKYSRTAPGVVGFLPAALKSAGSVTKWVDMWVPAAIRQAEMDPRGPEAAMEDVEYDFAVDHSHRFPRSRGLSRGVKALATRKFADAGYTVKLRD